ncbi:MAG: anti-sigma factor [Cyclobacteriaceae bacterium]
MELLNLILDNEATEAEQNYVHDHLESCMVCFEHYEVEKEIRELLKTKINSQPVPKDLASEIRLKIQIFAKE